MNYSFKELYTRFSNISEEDISKRVQNKYPRQTVDYIKGFLASIIKNPELALKYYIEPQDIALVLDVYGINAEGKRLSQAQIAKKYDITMGRVTARFASVVQTAKHQQTADEDLKL